MRSVFDLPNKEKELKKLEKEAEQPDFWRDKERIFEVQKEISRLKEKTETIKALRNELDELKELSFLSKEDAALEIEINKKHQILENKLKDEEIKLFLSGEYDQGNAVLSISAGAGGQDSQDWATMLLRMYERYCDKKGYKVKILHQSFGEGGGPEGRTGIKSVIFEIKGNFAYGLLKKEHGVHRLVRISPFSAQHLRHTSFALVEVLPDLSKKAEEEIKIQPQDIKIDFFRASGPGGQNVNKIESAVRITHLPTGIQVACQSERSQGKNREKAEKLLYAKIYRLQAETKKKELSEIKGKRISASWGNQIRSYVLHPYKLAKDHRTGLETSQVEQILNGNFDEFIEAEIKLKK